ncbi:FAD-dependent monooxygenase [Roseomonas sp. CECT 9278]|uniref:FAD-dependent monooxygenase n=1 Tax=Roseomonas sp. CECT 9278 TaxID=2845823 RepID=UPI001E633228|nr:FAD-dependent monooxygenase [Roseomonas sp. CECT 9278]CAH0213773.1 6-methylpretetramide 4-monooxygenase [Roseomonas sp. CECT 9278]
MTEPVLIVGAGPVGLTMAAELARYGVPIRIIDRAAARTDKSKALVLWPRSLELMDRLGCTGAFIAAGMRATGGTIRAEKGAIGHVSFAAEGTAYPFALMIPQSETERLFEDHLAAQGIQVERQVELLRFTPDADGAQATLRHPDGREETLHTPWLLGCDGAHSAVRRGLGMAFEGETLPSEWVLADVHLANVATPPDELAIHWHADGALVLFPISPGRWRVIADIGETDDTTARHEPTLAEVQALIDRRAPGGIVASDPVWLSGFRINERKVRDYSAGRVFLAGDAAHIHSPAGGQGMNTGMQDAFNLAWKLALVITGKAAAPALLPSYSIERSAVGDMVLANAGRMTAAATLRGDIRQGVRNFIASLVLQVPAVQRKIGQAMTELAIAYPASPLTVSGGAHTSGPAAGERMPPRAGEPPIGAGPAPRFAILAENTPDIATLFARHAALLEATPRPPINPKAAWLVRPDGYVALVGESAAVGAYLERLGG